VVYTFHNDRLEEDLRHEATHALLHVAVGDLPLWLDEGLAEYFEVPDRQGLNAEHLARLPDDLKGGWKPDLERLESLSHVRDMTPRDYRESWAWVHYLLNAPGASGKTALLAYLADLKTAPKTSPLSERLARFDRGPAQRMLTHLDRVRTAPPQAPVAAERANSDPTVLLQNAPIEANPRGSNRKGLFGRFLGLIGFSGKSD
jgi:hypothetical protein